MDLTLDFVGNSYVVNTHIHTPYSFSSFSSMYEIFELAEQENIKVLGINDFFVTDGYEHFAKLAKESRIHPLFNIEFIALSEEWQRYSTRVNDPANPGRVYLCGKALKNPLSLSPETNAKLQAIIAESQVQMRQMIDKLNAYLASVNAGIELSYETIKKKFAKNLVRERHLAQALRKEIFDREQNHANRMILLQQIYQNLLINADIDNHADLENELRNNFLKAGKPAFVPETPAAFMSISQALEIIKEAGGVPCYPVLLDAAKPLTDFESDKEHLLTSLAALGIYAIELIPQRNSIEALEPFVNFFHKKGFVVTFGTEHNSPGIFPLTPVCKNNTPLTDDLLQISYEGACVYAAHQHLKSQNQKGFKPESVENLPVLRAELAKLGHQVIQENLA